MLREGVPYHWVRFHCGYAATMADLPSRQLVIAVSATVRGKAAPGGKLSTDVLKEVAAYLVPEAPL
jgi:hypothetical protein